MVAPGVGAVSYEQGTPVEHGMRGTWVYYRGTSPIKILAHPSPAAPSQSDAKSAKYRGTSPIKERPPR